MATVYNYSPGEVQLVIEGFPIRGFADGTFITFEWAEDMYTTVVSADGEVSRVRSENPTGTLTITLKQTSDSNAFLEALATTHSLTNAATFAVNLLDSCNTEIFSAQGWIKKRAGLTLSKGIENREWVIELARAYVVVTPKLDSTQSAVEKISRKFEDLF